MRIGSKGLVRTVSERCRVCYTCVRECPAKAIRINEGQAEVIPERCIGCGNCVRVCSQNAKEVLDTTGAVWALLRSASRVAACVAPSFPAEFTDCHWRELVGMIRALGFDLVAEVGFGADLVANRYHKLLSETEGDRFIATSCPALVAYVERYFPDLVDKLAPIVSPMIASARALHRLHGKDLKIVFIGPCIAKKGEAESENLPGEVDGVITFIELRKMLAEANITCHSVGPGDFDPPHAGTGGLFSISRGLLQAADIDEDLIVGEVVAAEGRTNFVDAIKEFHDGALNAKLLEVLCCNGCIMGAGMSTDVPLFSRRSSVSQYVRERLAGKDVARLSDRLTEFDDLDLTRAYSSSDQRLAVPLEEEIRQIMARMGKFAPEDELNCGACGYETCREHAVAVHKGLAESEMCLPNTIERLRKTIGELAESNKELADVQEELMQSEKLASMGQIAAGIAHELNNPLGVVLMYAHLLLEQCDRNPGLKGDAAIVAEQADRCKKIVSGLLHFARQNRAALQPTNICELVDHALQALHVPQSVTVKVEHNLNDPTAELDSDQIVQVFTNLVTNAVGAMPDGGSLTVRTEGDDENVRTIVSDTGTGIAKESLSKIFDPFFTTKQIGKGTGLGLAVTYGIVKMHCGSITVQSNTDPTSGPTGSTFTVTLPRRGRQEKLPAAGAGTVGRHAQQ